MLYQIPDVAQWRFAVLEDTEANLSSVEAHVIRESTWTAFMDDYKDDLLSLEIETGAYDRGERTLVTDGSSYPVFSCLSPSESVLLVFSDYVIVDGSYSYGGLRGVLKLYPVSTSLTDSDESLVDVWASMSHLAQIAATKDSVSSVYGEIKVLSDAITRLSQREDPASVMKGSITSMINEYRQKIAALSTQVGELSFRGTTNDDEDDPEVDGVKVYSRDYLDGKFTDIEAELDAKIDVATYESVIDSRASQQSLDTHALDRNNPHRVTAAQTGAPTLAVFAALKAEVASLKDRVEFFEDKRYVETIDASGGLLAQNKGSGRWLIDGSLLDPSLADDDGEEV